MRRAAAVLQSRAYELMPGDVVKGRGRVVGVDSNGQNAGWLRVMFEGGATDPCVSWNQVYLLDRLVPWDGKFPSGRA